jgi:hypothetical protein
MSQTTRKRKIIIRNVSLEVEKKVKLRGDSVCLRDDTLEIRSLTIEISRVLHITCFQSPLLTSIFWKFEWVLEPSKKRSSSFSYEISSSFRFFLPIIQLSVCFMLSKIYSNVGSIERSQNSTPDPLLLTHARVNARKRIALL